MKSLQTVSKDSSTLISLEEAKAWLNVIGDDDNILIQSMITGAVAYAENYLNRTIGSNVYIMAVDTFDEVSPLMRAPVETIEAIDYIDTDGAIQSFDILKTKLDKDSGSVYLKTGEAWPSIANEPFAVKVSYTCAGSYAANDANDVLDAIKLTIGHRYDYRDDPNQRWRKASDNILQPLRTISF